MTWIGPTPPRGMKDDQFFEGQQAFLALQEVPLTAPMLASALPPDIGQVFAAEQSFLAPQEVPLTAPMLASLVEEHEDEQLLLQPSPTAPMLASLAAESPHADFSAQQEVEHSLPTAPALTVELPVVAQPRRAQERKRAARPVTRIMIRTPSGSVKIVILDEIRESAGEESPAAASGQL